jgi:SAM-dependent methyltransferase
VTRPPADHALQAYEVFASFYDSFTAGHRNDEWTAMVLDAARAAGLRGKRLLDVACGTGESFVAMLERGFEVTACDVSPAMAAIAASKAGDRATVSVQDMRELPRLGEFDLVWCLGDSLNYMRDVGELEAALRGMRRNLAPDGIVAFDVNTLATFRRVYSSILVVPGERDVIVLHGHGRPDLEPGGTASVWIDHLTARDTDPTSSGSTGGDGWERARSVHHHRHHPAAEIERALAAAGLETVARWGSSKRGLHDFVDERSQIKTVYTARHARLTGGKGGD